MTLILLATQHAQQEKAIMKTLEAKADKIFKLSNDLNHFIKTDNEINKAFQDFRKTGVHEKNIYDFLFETSLTKGKKLIDIYIEQNSDLPADEKTLLKSMKNTINSVFEVKIVNKEGFELYNLINEKNYTVKSLIKMVNYRGIFRGNYILCRIIPCEGEFYLFSIDKILKYSDKTAAYTWAVEKQMKDTSSVYLDNDEKLGEIEEDIAFLRRNFEKFFKTDEIITINTKISALLDAFNEYVDDEAAETDIEEFIEQPETYAYFDINKKRNSSKTYDTGIMFDPESGLQVVPFFSTFSKIFEIDDYKSIGSYRECIKNFFYNDKISPYVLRKVYDRFGENFLQRVVEVLKIKKEVGFEDLMQRYKQDFLVEKKFSTPTILYSSKSFEKLMQLSGEAGKKDLSQNDKNELTASALRNKTGRNAPCPCGSGKKYKKCCL